MGKGTPGKEGWSSGKKIGGESRGVLVFKKLPFPTIRESEREMSLGGGSDNSRRLRTRETKGGGSESLFASSPKISSWRDAGVLRKKTA